MTATLEELLRLKAEARGFSFLPKQPIQSLLSGRHSSRLRGRGLSFDELRHYQPGDDVRTIDWRATARRRSTQVRVYNDERERPVLLIVDQRSPMFFGSQRAMKSVTAAELAALAAWRTLAVGDRIGALVFNEDKISEFRPQRSEGQALRIIHELTRMNQLLASPDPASGTVQLNHALKAAQRIATHDHLILLISDLDGVDDNTRQIVTSLSAHNDLLIGLVYDPLGANLQGGAEMRASDRGEVWEIPRGAAFAKNFKSAFADRLDQWRDIFRSLRVPLLPITTAEPPADQIRSLIGAPSFRR
ncbi:MAG: DUF58 domain-containing protein [Verrucomicrobiales bacterium]